MLLLMDCKKSSLFLILVEIITYKKPGEHVFLLAGQENNFELALSKLPRYKAQRVELEVHEDSDVDNKGKALCDRKFPIIVIRALAGRPVTTGSRKDKTQHRKTRFKIPKITKDVRKKKDKKGLKPCPDTPKRKPKVVDLRDDDELYLSGSYAVKPQVILFHSAVSINRRRIGSNTSGQPRK
jgi:hypothetical protein